jgi:Flp pilus assembly protein TadG
MASMQKALEKKGNRMKAGNRAQAMAEFALVIPVMLLIVWGIIESAHLLYVYNAVVVGSREASRFAAGVGTYGQGNITDLAHWQDCQGIRNAAKRVSPLLSLQDNDIQISIIHKDVVTQAWMTTPVCLDNNPDKTTVPIVNLGDRITVSVIARYSPLVPLVQFQTLPSLWSDSTHTILFEVPIS